MRSIDNLNLVPKHSMTSLSDSPCVRSLYWPTHENLVLMASPSVEGTCDSPEPWQLPYKTYGCYSSQRLRPRGYQTFFMLNVTEHEIYPAHKC